MFKKTLGLGLVGHLNTYFAARSTELRAKELMVACELWHQGYGHIMVCFDFPREPRSPKGVAGFEYSAMQADSLDDLGVPSGGFFYTFEGDSLERIFSRLNNEVAESRRQFPNLRYVRIFPLPSRDHKRQYLLRSARTDEKWLNDAFMLHQNNPSLRQRMLREEYINGSWLPYRTIAPGHASPAISLRAMREAVFTPYYCTAEAHHEAGYVLLAYALSDETTTVVARGGVDLFPFDLWIDIEVAFQEERDALKGSGLRFSSEEFDLLPTLQEYDGE